MKALPGNTNGTFGHSDNFGENQRRYGSDCCTVHFTGVSNRGASYLVLTLLAGREIIADFLSFPVEAICFNFAS